MLIYILTVIVITQTHSLQTDRSHNRIVRHKTEYRVNISMIDDDIEMVEKDFIEMSNASKVSKINKKFHKALHIKNLDDKNNTEINPKAANNTQNRSRDEFVNLKTYQANSSMKSKYSDRKSEEKLKKAHYIVEIDGNKTQSRDDLAIVPRIARDITGDRVWSIVQIWLTIYIILAIPLWCTIGRCCCCLVCKRFRAQETIREAKLYAMWNPPGVLRKSTGDVTYTPTDKEKEAYEELEHLIRTL